MTADAFGRLRVSQPTTIWDDQQFYGDSGLRWENATTGNAAAASNRISGTTIESSVRLTPGDTVSGSKVYRQTRIRHRYQPGKSQLVLMTFVAGAAYSNCRRRVGLFDANDGIFLEETNGVLSLVRRTNVTGTPTDNAVAHASWNIDTFDGTGPSGKTLDFTKTNILVIDAQWLGVGRVRVGFSIDGVIYPAHQFLHAGVLTEVYTTTLCLPLRYEIENTGTAGGVGTFDHICTAIMSEGGFEDPSGLTFTANNGVTTIAVTTRRPVLSIQANTIGPNSVRNIGHIIPKAIDLLVSTNSCLYEVVLNGTLTGASWAQVNATYSLANLDVAATAISGGVVLASGYVASAAGAARASAREELFRELPLVYTGLNNVQDVLSIVCTSLSGTSNVAAAIDWKELY